MLGSRRDIRAGGISFMTRRIRALRISPFAVLALGVPALAADGLAVSVDLPDGQTWTQVTNQVVGNAYSREWVPAGQTSETADWLIAQQKVPVDRNVEPTDFLQDVYGQLDNACTDAAHDDPERIRIGNISAVAGRTMCAQRKNERFGVFSDQLVIVDGGYAYIVTSELRIPPMIVAGVVSFGHGDESHAAAAAFQRKQTASRELVREHVRIEKN
jgi:hypothetical protein